MVVLKLIFIGLSSITIILIKMASIENKTDTTSRKMLPHFKSTNCFETATNAKGNKIKRDLSTISNYYVPSERKNSNDLTLTARPDSKSLLDSLPDIYSKHRAQKRSGFLEMWLEEALDPQEGKGKVEGQVEVEKTGPLRTVQKFEIDKKYLKSQNISGEVVQKLYNSLYVYTYGLNNTFNDVLALTKTSEHAERRIVNSFWRAFIKLLEGCTSFRTSFQVIEESYKKQATELRDSFAVREATNLEQIKRLEEEIVRLNKRISEQSYTITKLTSDYNIAESALTLTDQAFNDEVSLRLKFEEKVNSIFTSYEEIRHKYDRLLGDLRLRGEEEVVTRQMEIALKAKLQQAEIRIIELNRQLVRMEEVVVERDREFQIKRQEIYQLNGIIAELREKNEADDEHVRRMVLKIDHFRQENDRLLNEMSIRDTQVAGLAHRIKEQQVIIDRARSANEIVYQKYEITGKQLGEFNVERLMLESHARDAKDEAAAAMEGQYAAEKRRDELQDQVAALEYQVRILQLDVETKGDCLAKNVEVIRNLQAVKDKFERMYTITFAEKDKMEGLMNEAVRSKEMFEEQITGMRMLLENRGVELDQANNKLQNERQVFRSKITSLRDQVGTKEGQILDLHNKQLEDQDLVTSAVERMKAAEILINSLREEKLRLQGDLLQKEQLIQQGRTERDKSFGILRELNTKLEQIGRQHQSSETNLSNKTSVLEQIRGRADKQKDLLRKLLESYREDREKKVSYIHPMIFEDCRMQIDRNTIKIGELNATNAQLMLDIEALKQTIEQHLATINILKNGLLKSEQENINKKQIISTLQSAKKDLEGRLTFLRKEGIEQSSKMQEKLNKDEKKIEDQRLQMSKLNEQLDYSKKAIKNQHESIEKLENQRKIQKLHFQAQEDELGNMKAEIVRLKEEVSALKRTDSKNSARTQVLKRKSTLKDMERDTGSKGQEREHLETPKPSNHEETYRSEDYPLKPIQQQAQIKQENYKKNHVSIHDGKIQARPSTVDRDVQTEKEKQKQKQKEKQKQKSKFSHSFKFEHPRPTVQSYGCQVDLLPNGPQGGQGGTHHNSPTGGGSHSLHKPRIESQEFKRALKLTYMRR